MPRLNRNILCNSTKCLVSEQPWVCAGRTALRAGLVLPFMMLLSLGLAGCQKGKAIEADFKTAQWDSLPSDEQIAPRYQQARDYMEQAQWTLAEEMLRDLAQGEPSNPAYRNDLGVCLLKMERFKKADKAFQPRCVVEPCRRRAAS